MPDHDLVAYLDGEADAAAAARIAEALRTDPETRRQALALLRQRVALSRILPALAPAAPRAKPRGRQWWLAATALACAAAAAVVAAIIAGHGRAGRPIAPVTPIAPAVIALADGSTWAVHATIGADGAPITARLADGTLLRIGAGSALTVPAPGEPWRLDRGSLTAEAPEGAVSLSAGIVTQEVAVALADGRLALAVDGDGSRVRMLAGQATTRDLLTGGIVMLAAGAQRWIPSDAAAPREGAGQEGTVRGTVVAVGSQGRSVTIHTRFGETVLTPLWTGAERGGLDRAMCQRLEELNPDDRVAIAWLWQEHLRVTGLRLIETPARGAPAGDDF
jgi:hypothetical protein